MGLAWDVFGDGTTAVRAGYGLYFNTNNHQNLIVTVTNPPATPRPVIINPTFPNPPFDRAAAISIRPVQWDLENPRVHVWNANVQRELWLDATLTVGYAGSRGRHLLRSGDVNLAQPDLRRRRPFIPAGTPRQNPAFSTIELKSSDGDSWYNALIVDVRRRWSRGVSPSSRRTRCRRARTRRRPRPSSRTPPTARRRRSRVGPRLQQGAVGLRRPAQLGRLERTVGPARGAEATAWRARCSSGWRLSGIWNMRSGQPLTVFVQSNRSRSQWNPSLGPGIGQRSPRLRARLRAGQRGAGPPEQWFDPNAFVLQPAGTFGNTGRGDFRGPNLRTLDLSLTRDIPWTRLGPAGGLEFRLEVFNVLNRANFGVPSLTAFAGTGATEQPFATFGRISSTVTSARQMQLGIRARF
jgi:hypothetical protein